VVVLVCGDRNWVSWMAIRRRLLGLPRDAVIIHGDRRGADSIAEAEAICLGFKVQAYLADQKRFGHVAGLIRNTEMLTEGCPDLVLAFHNDLSKSEGTRDIVRKAVALGIPVEVIGNARRGK